MSSPVSLVSLSAGRKTATTSALRPSSVTLLMVRFVIDLLTSRVQIPTYVDGGCGGTAGYYASTATFQGELIERANRPTSVRGDVVVRSLQVAVAEVRGTGDVPYTIGGEAIEQARPALRTRLQCC